MVFTKASDTLLVGEDNGIRICKCKEAKNEQARIAGVKNVCFLALTHDDKTLISVSSDRSVRLWEFKDRKEKRRLDAKAVVASCSHDGLVLAVSDEDKKAIRVYDVTRDQWIGSFKIEDMKVFNLAVSPDGEVVALGDKKTIALMEVMSGQVVVRHSLPANIINAIAFAPDGRTIASANSFTPEVLLWDCTGCEWDQSKMVLKAPKFEPDQMWDALGSEDTRLANKAVWTLSMGDEAVRAMLRERLHPAKWNRKQIEQLVSDLGSELYEVRKTATKELENIGEAAEPLLKKTLSAGPNLEGRRRIEAILQRISTNPDHMRTRRAIRILEHMGDDTSLRILESLATGSEEAVLTQKAKGALARMRTKSAPP
jgi:hypothetical protein